MNVAGVRASAKNGATAAGLALALVVSFTGCSDPSVAEGQAEIAAELRAVRAALQADRAGPVADTNAPTADENRAALTAALAPLREVLVTLVRDVDEMRARQQALTGELNRWSQLLAQVAAAPRASGPEGAGGGANDAAIQQLLTRLGELESQMKSQDDRHREVEGMIATALDRTSSRLEDFLQRMSALRPGGTAPVDPANANPASARPGNGDPGSGDPGSGDPGPGNATTGNPATGNRAAGNPGETGKKESSSGNPTGGNQNQGGDNDGLEQAGGTVGYGPRPSPSFWWFGVAAVALILSGMFALWLARENRAGATAQLDDDAAGEDGARELWAAAALLGEAVGRLRDRDGEPDGTETAPSPFDAFAAQPTAGDPASDPMALLQQLAGQVGEAAPDPPPRDDWREAPVADAAVRDRPPDETVIELAEEPVAAAAFEPAAGEPVSGEPALEEPAEAPDDAAMSPAGEAAAPLAAPADPGAKPEHPGTPTISPAAAAPTRQHDRPPTIEFTLPATDPAAAAVRAAQALTQEPRVLRRPAAECTPHETAVLVRYHVVPGTPDIERSRIEGRVRIAVH